MKRSRIFTLLSIVALFIGSLCISFKYTNLKSGGNSNLDFSEEIEGEYLADTNTSSCKIKLSSTSVSFYTKTSKSPSSAQITATASGNCGSNAKWSITASGNSVLYKCTISGTSTKATIKCSGTNGTERTSNMSYNATVKYGTTSASFKVTILKVSKTASTSGCYSCGNSYIYYKKGTELGSSCSTTVNSNYQKGTNSYTCVKKASSSSNVAPSSGCYACENGSQGTITYKYYSKNSTLPSGCGTTVYSNYTSSSTTNGSTCSKNTSSSNSSSSSGSSSSSSGASSNGTSTYSTKLKSISVATVSTSTEDTINDYRYVLSGATYQGDTATCGDKVYITTCDDEYCNINSINGNSVSTTTKVYKNKLSTSDTTNSCSEVVRYVNEKGSVYSNLELTSGEESISCGSTVKFTKSPGDACTATVCEVSYNNKTVYINSDLLSLSKQSCSSTCESSKAVKDLKGDTTVNLCYVYKDNSLTEQDLTTKDVVSCADSYVQSYNMVEDNCKNVSTNNQTCQKTYKYTCSLSARPGLSASGGVVGSNGKGTITFTAKDNGTSGIKGYFISSGSSPTVNSNWKSFSDTTYTATETVSPGTYFIWTISNDNRISYSILSRIHDSEPSTTLNSLSIKSGDDSETYDATALDDGGSLALADKDIKYVKLSNSLNNDSVIASFDSYTTAYEVTVNSNKIAVYATLTSNDASYVSGYEPRTVDLDYGRNVILIKIVNKSGRERTYTIIANRIDDRQSNNLLKDLTVSAGSISFDSYVSDYTITVPKNTKTVTINGTLDSELASFVSGYEPREITLDGAETSAVIKTVSEAGIVRSYVLTFVKNGEEIDNNFKNSVCLSSLSIPGTQLDFDKETKSYSVSVPYEIEEIPIYAFAESSTAKVEIRGNQGLKVGANAVEVEVINGSKSRIYTIYINRREDGLNIASDTTLSTLTIKGYELNFDPSILDYTVKIKKEKTLIITATPYSNRSEVYMFGNNDLTGFSTVRIKVIAEDGSTGIYSIDIQKDAYDKELEKNIAISAGIIILIFAILIVVRKKYKKRKEYMEEI